MLFPVTVLNLFCAVTSSIYINGLLIARKCVSTSDLGMTKEWFTRILIRLLTKGPKKKDND